jgi:bifunctional glutamyl/prolyl-tRNA synthetase
MFDISFEDPESHEKRFAYQNSWAITTRSIGIVVMVHGDDKGLVLPPRIAQIQAVVVPCGVTAQLAEADKKQLIDKCDELVKSLQASDIRVRGDYRDNYSPGWKFNHWELKGVPIRIEIGPRDMQNSELVAVRRDTGEKQTLKFAGAVQSIAKLLEDIQSSMFDKTKKELKSNVATCTDFSELCNNLDKNKIIMAPFCGAIKCEETIKTLSARDAVTEDGAPAMGAKGLCIPFKQPATIKSTDKCICPNCPAKPEHYTLFGRSY